MTEDKAVEKGIENQFNIFLLEYLKNVKKELPTSIRAQQMKTGGFSSELVIEFETKFLKEPFLKALQITSKAKEEEMSNVKLELLQRPKRKFLDEANGQIIKQLKQIKQLQKENEELKYEPKKRWLKFIDISNPKNKTKILIVKNKENDCGLGEIKWDCGWRQYVFDDGSIKMAEGCQYEVFEKIKEIRLEKQKLKSK